MNLGQKAAISILINDWSASADFCCLWNFGVCYEI